MLLPVGPWGQTEWLVGCVDEAEVICLRKGFERMRGLVGRLYAGTALSVCGLIGI